MFGLLPQTLQYWYKNFLSDYNSDIENNKWHPCKTETVDTTTGEVFKNPIYVFKKENLGENMSIDDKSIGNDVFTILSNYDTGKIALMIEGTKAEDVEMAMEQFGDELKTIKNISMDMSAAYALAANNQVPFAKQVIDKFHVLKYVYEAVSEVRNKIRKKITATLSKGKKKTEEDKQKLSDLEQLRRVRHAITQSPEKWSEKMKETVNEVFEKHSELKKAYLICQSLKSWYNYKNHTKSIKEIFRSLYQWYNEADEVEEFESVVKMIQKHEDEIVNFFHCGITNAKAERLNGKIKRFVSNNYGVKDRDFILYRIAGYFS